jgi:hypothetical protein
VLGFAAGQRPRDRAFKDALDEAMQQIRKFLEL